MSSSKKPELILIDFDGVISKNSPDIILDFFHETLNEITPVSKDYLKLFFRICGSFPTALSMDYLFKSLGIEGSIDIFSKKFAEGKKNTSPLFKIEDAFFEFIEFCKQNQIQYKIFSLADEGHLSVLKMDKKDFYQLGGASKADLKTFEVVKKELNVGEILYIDDSPFGLRTGKLCGLTTVMMLNTLFNIEDYTMFEKHIDYKVESFSEIQRIIEQL